MNEKNYENASKVNNSKETKKNEELFKRLEGITSMYNTR